MHPFLVTGGVAETMVEQRQGDGGSDGCGGGAWCWRCSGDEVVTFAGMT
nr:hypothetical protein [Tanacetum cinerariifolium]